MNGPGTCSRHAWQWKGLLEANSHEWRVTCGFRVAAARAERRGADTDWVGSWVKPELGFCSGQSNKLGERQHTSGACERQSCGAPEDIYILIPGTSAYVRLHGKQELE